MSPLLSICIPTYNRESFLKECLNSISGQINKDDPIEVVISDNASTDNTSELVSSFNDKLNLKYVINEKNIGSDANCLNVVKHATGSYCLILGSDDCLYDAALGIILGIIREDEGDLIHYGYTQCGIDIKDVKCDVPVQNKISTINTRSESLYPYLAGMSHISNLFAFISTFVFRRSMWDAIQDKEKYIGSQYIHLFVIYSIIHNGCKIFSVPECLVYARGNNPNEWNSEPGKFLSLDIKTFNRIVVDIFSHEQAAYIAFGCVFKKQYSYKGMLILLTTTGAYHVAANLKLLKKFGYNKLFLFFISYVTNSNKLKCFLQKIIFSYRLLFK